MCSVAMAVPPAIRRRRQPEAFDPKTMRLIRRTARQLARRPGFTDADREDLEQELALELVQRCSAHDPGKGTLAAFAAGVLRRRAADLLREQGAKKRGGGGQGLSLNDEVRSEDGERVERADTLDAADGERRLDKESPSALEQCACRMDMEAVLARLPERLRRLCELLKGVPVAEAARHAGITRATLRGELRRLRGIWRGISFSRANPRPDSDSTQ